MSTGRTTPKIIHVDMDAFYASVEQRDRADLRGRPVIVGGDPDGRGVVAAASYEARRFGVRSAMPAARARRLCPDAVFLPPDFTRYQQASAKILAICREVTAIVEPLSLDEAFLDVTDNRLREPCALKVAQWLRRRIRLDVGLVASAGVGPNKFVAKVASALRKPDGLVVVEPEDVEDFVGDLPVERLWGVGPATSRRLRNMGLRTAKDVRRVPAGLLETALGKVGRQIHRLAHGDDPRPVEAERTPKYRSAETTFGGDLTDIDALVRVTGRLARQVAGTLTKEGRQGRTITLKVRYADFDTVSRSKTLSDATDDADEIARRAEQLLRSSTEAGRRPVRLVGVAMSGLVAPDAAIQLTFGGKGVPPSEPVDAQIADQAGDRLEPVAQMHPEPGGINSRVRRDAQGRPVFEREVERHRREEQLEADDARGGEGGAEVGDGDHAAHSDVERQLELFATG